MHVFWERDMGPPRCNERTRVWVLPFDAATGQVKGEGKPETPAGMDAWSLALSSDDELAYVAFRTGKQELWQKTLSASAATDGADTLLASDEFIRNYLCWSRDGKYLAYRRDG